MLTLYYMKGACSLVAHTALEWAQAGYEAREIGRDELTSPDYLALNPRGSVPLLQDGDWTLSQNIAILQYLNGRYPAARLFGGGDAKAQAEAWQWLGFANSDVHPAFGALFRPDAGEAARDAALKRLHMLYAQADKALQNRDYLTGELTIADVYLYVTLRWAKMLQVDLSAFAALERWYQRVEADAGVQAALKAEGLLS